jgi:hypothetical protein
MNLFYVQYPRPERVLDRAGQHRYPILESLAIPDHDLIRVKIDVFNPQVRAFGQSKTRSVQQPRSGTIAMHRLRA